MNRKKTALRAHAWALCALAGMLASAPAAAQQITMKIAFPTIRSGMEEWANTFKQGVDNRAPGRVKIDIFPGGQLGSQPATIQGVQLGTIEMAQTPPETMTGVDPRFDIFSAPMLFDDIPHSHRALHDAQFKKAFWPILEAKDMRLIGIACEAVTDYTFPEPVRSLAEFKGKKIRVLGSKLEVEIMRRLGATGVPLQLAEAIPALQQRAIDGVRGGVMIFVPFKFQTMARNLVLTGESIVCPAKFVNKRWFDGLPADIRNIMLEEAAKSDDINLASNVQTVAKMYEIWKKAGGVVIELPAADRAELRRRLQPIGDEVFKDLPQVKSAYEVLKAAAQRTRKK